jgi:RNA recognition motif-containing protein
VSNTGGRWAPSPFVPKTVTRHSDFALWVGNVPSDALEDELWAFFDRFGHEKTGLGINSDAGDPGPGGRDSEDEREEARLTTAPTGAEECTSKGGVTSIRIIPRSNCAFVNYADGESLQKALEACDGKKLRPDDLASKPLVCRVRTRADAAKTGVGAQRGWGMHRTWVVQQQVMLRQKEQQAAAVTETTVMRQGPPSTTDPPSAGSSAGTSASASSTGSYFLSKHFPKRFFILKVSGVGDGAGEF